MREALPLLPPGDPPRHRHSPGRGRHHLDLGDADAGDTLPLMSNSADARRRWLGLFFLTLSAGMLIWGQTILRPHLTGFAFAVYWLACFGFTFVTIFIALLDVRAVRRRLREEQREQADLLRRTLEDIQDKTGPGSRPPPGQG